MADEYLSSCGATGCPNPVKYRCGYCDIPMCKVHRRVLKAASGEEYYCGACYAYISVSGLMERELDRHLVPNILLTNSKKCTGCRSCELACSFEHFDVFSYDLSAVRVLKFEDRARNYPIVCLQCDDPPCVDVCPANALVKNDENGMVSFDEKECTGCEECVEACPFNAAFFSTKKKKLIMCDLCGGDPVCVKVCAPEALEWIKKYKVGERRRLVLDMNPYNHESLKKKE